MSRRGVWWRLAWRNLWRNRRRTLITASALAFGYWACVIIIGIWYGMVDEMLENGTNLMSGQVQVHAADFLPERSLYSTLGGNDGLDVDALLVRIEETEGVTAVAPRTYGGGLISSGEETAGVILVGVRPERELTVTRVLRYLVAGRLPKTGAREVVIGDELAEQIEVGVGDEVVVVAPAADGSMGNDLFTVAGLLHTGTQAFDAVHVFLPSDDLHALLWLDPGRIHEMVVSVADPWAAPSVSDSIMAGLAAMDDDEFSVRPWTVYRAELAEYTQLAFAANGVVVAIIFGMAVFGVANTMLMSTFERRREFAVLRAMGTGPGQVARTVVFEGLILGIVALAAGTLIAAPTLWWLHEFPVELGGSGFSRAGATIRPVLRAEYSWDGPMVSAVGLLVTSIVAALYPAWKAVRIPPADALAD